MITAFSRRVVVGNLPKWVVGLLLALDVGGLLDLEQEVVVVAGRLHLLQEQLKRLLHVQRVEDAAKLPGDLQLLRRHQDLFLAGARRVDVHRGEDPLVRELAVELELHVAGALELLEDDLVHARAGLDERRGEDRQRPAVLDVARSAEEPLRRVERGRVDAAGEDPAARRRREVVGATEPGDGVEEYDDVVAELDEPLGPLDRQLRDHRVIVGGTVEGRGDDLTLHRALHVRDLFGALVDEHDHEMHFRVVGGDRVGDRLQHHRLARLGRRHDQAALTLADRADQVDDASGEDAGLGLQPQPVLRVERHQLVEVGAALGLLRVDAVDGVKTDKRVELLAALALARLANCAGDGVALAQAVATDLGQRDIDVVGARQVAGRTHEGVVVEDVDDAADGDEDVVLGDDRLGVATEAVAVAIAVALPEAAAAGATGAELVVAALLLVAALSLLGVLALLGVLTVALLTVALLTAALLPTLTLAVALLAIALLPGLALPVVGLALPVGLLALTRLAITGLDIAGLDIHGLD